MHSLGARTRSQTSRGFTSLAILAALVLTLVFAATGFAAAQADGPSLVASGDDVTVTEGTDDNPDTYWVDEPGEYDITITGSDFTVDVFVLACPGAGGSLDALAEGEATALCDLGNLFAASPDDDGMIEATFEGIEIDGCGLVFGAGDSAQTESSAVLVGVSNPPDDVECEVVEADLSAGYGDEEEVAAEALADTGLSSAELALLASTILGAGMLMATEGRRIARSSV